MERSVRTVNGKGSLKMGTDDGQEKQMAQSLAQASKCPYSLDYLHRFGLLNAGELRDSDKFAMQCIFTVCCLSERKI